MLVFIATTLCAEAKLYHQYVLGIDQMPPTRGF